MKIESLNRHLIQKHFFLHLQADPYEKPTGSQRI